MAGWLAKLLISLTFVTISGVTGGTIGHLTNKSQQEIEADKTQLTVIQATKTTTPITQEIIKVPKNAKICKWLGTKGYPKMRDKTESACRKFAENRLNIKFKG
ncbi:hypothetical protein A6V39_03420 [Candidatus Mycoplasma haematobovis]|uniref:Uncharacterized protein n=1 Tax=Candidatus Mycoplasma haematobovis TaxID=432608 RepID=A0A1A9QDA6_9MOLU|nr:hypothetical protein [Candidatus Mycoplasma haematobovis]OAL09935.1 hypothetical protein A6V39_03420 [Candidatus Mycoplasma haematobovis]